MQQGLYLPKDVILLICREAALCVPDAIESIRATSTWLRDDRDIQHAWKRKQRNRTFLMQEITKFDQCEKVVGFRIDNWSKTPRDKWCLLRGEFESLVVQNNICTIVLTNHHFKSYIRIASQRTHPLLAPVVCITNDDCDAKETWSFVGIQRHDLMMGAPFYPQRHGTILTSFVINVKKLDS